MSFNAFVANSLTKEGGRKTVNQRWFLLDYTVIFVAGWQKLLLKGFFSFPFVLSASPLLLALCKLGGSVVPSEPGKSLRAWLAAVEGWHGPGAQGSGAGGGTVHSLLASSVLLVQNSVNQRFLFFKEGMTEKGEESELLKPQRMDFSKLWRSPAGRGGNLMW